MGEAPALVPQRLVADSETALDEAGEFSLVEQGDGGVRRGDATASLGVADGLVAAEAEPPGALSGEDVAGGAEVGPQPVGRAKDVQPVPGAAHGHGVLLRQPEPVE